MFFVNSFIKVCKNTLTSDQHKKLVEQLDSCLIDSLDPVTGKLIWDRVKTYDKYEKDEVVAKFSDKRTCTRMNNKSAAYDLIHKIIEPIISKQVCDYIEHFQVPLLEKDNSQYSILRYEAGQTFVTHSDDGFVSNRRLSSTLYINDNYTGGELYFDKQDYKIKPDAGDLIIFPSAFPYSHEARPVKTGVKYCVINFWT